MLITDQFSLVHIEPWFLESDRIGWFRMFSALLAANQDGLSLLNRNIGDNK